MLITGTVYRCDSGVWTMCTKFYMHVWRHSGHFECNLYRYVQYSFRDVSLILTVLRVVDFRGQYKCPLRCPLSTWKSVNIRERNTAGSQQALSVNPDPTIGVPVVLVYYLYCPDEPYSIFFSINDFLFASFRFS